MTEDDEKLAGVLEKYVAMLRSGDWSAARWRWSPESGPVRISYQELESKQQPKSEVISHEFEFLLIKSDKGNK